MKKERKKHNEKQKYLVFIFVNRELRTVNKIRNENE
jgi:hypothetical protein